MKSPYEVNTTGHAEQILRCCARTGQFVFYYQISNLINPLNPICSRERLKAIISYVHLSCKFTHGALVFAAVPTYDSLKDGKGTTVSYICAGRRERLSETPCLNGRGSTSQEHGNPECSVPRFVGESSKGEDKQIEASIWLELPTSSPGSCQPLVQRASHFVI